MPRKRHTPIRERKPGTKKPGVSRDRFKKDKAFKGSRRAAGELGQGSDTARLIRQAFRTVLGDIPQNITQAQLTGIGANLIREQKKAGVRRIRLNKLRWEKLRGFELNTGVTLTSALISHYKVDIRRRPATIDVTLYNIAVTTAVIKVPSITHIRVVAGAAAIDFEEEKISKANTETAYIPVRPETTEPIRLSMQLSPPDKGPLFVVLGMVIFKKDDSGIYDLHNLRFRPFSIIAVDPAPQPVYKKKTAAKPKAPAKKKRAAKPAVAKKDARKAKKKTARARKKRS